MSGGSLRIGGLSAATDALRVMIVDDSVVVRAAFTRWLDHEPDLTVVAALRNGREGVDALAWASPDVVILDVEMPELDGLAALPLLLAKNPDLVVIMASALTRRDAETSLKALALGAMDCLPKPVWDASGGATAAFRRELVEKVREIGSRRKLRVNARARPVGDALATRRYLAARLTASEATPRSSASSFAPRALVVGASTGGPQALAALIPALVPICERAPILIAQHMPAMFTAVLAEHLTRAAGRPVREAADGEPVAAGDILLAPGGRHMVVETRGAKTLVRLKDGAADTHCKPAVDLLFASAAKVWGGATVAAILTGMGQDGVEGARAITAAGGTVIAQDEVTSAVWGMPGAAVAAGVCSAVLSLDRMAAHVAAAFVGDAP